VFSNTAGTFQEHYSPTGATELEFRDASLQLVKGDQSYTLAGNLQLYSKGQQEPGPPMYISLVRTSATEHLVAAAASSTPKAEVKQVDGLVAYPNPFTSSLHMSFQLPVETKVTITLCDLAGRTLVSKQSNLQAGPHQQTLKNDLPAGLYVVKLIYGGQVYTSIVVKQ
jgi:hypothetical protein